MATGNLVKLEDVRQLEGKGYYLVMLLFVMLVAGLAAVLSWAIQLEFNYIYDADFFSGVQQSFLPDSSVADLSARLVR